MGGEVLLLLLLTRVYRFLYTSNGNGKSIASVTEGPTTEESPVTAWVPERAWTITQWISGTVGSPSTARTPARAGRPTMEMLKV